MRKVLRHITQVLGIAGCLTLTAAPVAAHAQTQPEPQPETRREWSRGQKLVAVGLGAVVAGAAVATVAVWGPAALVGGAGVALVDAGVVTITVGYGAIIAGTASWGKETHRKSRETQEQLERNRIALDEKIRLLEEGLRRDLDPSRGANVSRSAETQPQGASTSTSASGGGASAAGMSRK